jgi:hypothetical protein
MAANWRFGFASMWSRVFSEALVCPISPTIETTNGTFTPVIIYFDPCMSALTTTKQDVRLFVSVTIAVDRKIAHGDAWRKGEDFRCTVNLLRI